jgi:DedD protein
MLRVTRIAEEISKSLKALSLKSFINKAQVDGTVMYNIFVGPKIDKKRALADKELIDKSLGTSSMVIPLNLSDM